ncbi:X2-like carbohydrate binding domain-containing protein [Bifidobacterium platyrrhinorum]|uniref:Carbohydrate binding X2 domain-containing protein n=1 Tax=Bifidobacterium platyrrhinorum TaxID=2661628 RepID=A0A6L9SR80_9BIFI|nr:X2-like carbohydrate binding domain-containing protein [Bifidobacterium platyrrhinorum]NEG54994.1 hypothetical protein [Bifidobacterium platyrrhinorum]
MRHGLCKAVIAALASITMIATGAATASAAQAPGVTVPQQGGYSATKISHPDAALGADDGILNVDANGNPTAGEGTNDRGQSYSWSAVGYGDWMYVGTCYSAMGSTLKIMASQLRTDYATLKAGIDALFNGNLFLDSGENHSLLLKINTRTGEVRIVQGPIRNVNGVSVSGYRSAIEFHDKLYFAASAQPTPYLVEVDPATDAVKTVYTSGKVADRTMSVGIRGLAVVGDQLVASMIGQYGDNESGAYIVASSDPSAGQDSFRIVGTQQDLLDYPAYHYTDEIFGGAIWDMVGFDGRMYVTVVTGKNGGKRSFALFRATPKATGRWDYKLLVGDKAQGAAYDFGFGADRSGAANLVVYKDHLYIGGYNDPMVALPDAMQFKFENLYKDLNSPVNLWRMDADERFQMVAGEANDAFPEGPIGTIDGATMRAGLGSDDEASRFLNQYVWRMQSYDGKLYAGTFDISDLAYPATQFANGDILHRTPEEWQKQIDYVKAFIEALRKSQNDKKDKKQGTSASSDGQSAGQQSDGQSAGQQSDAAAQSDESSSEATAPASEDDLKAATLSADGDAQAVQSDVERMQTLLGDMQGDLTAAPATASADGVTTYSADAAPSAQDRERFYNQLTQLRDLLEKNRANLPDSLVKSFDEWLTQANVENFGYFVGTMKYLSSATKEKRGFDLVTSADGVHFSTVTRNGLGDNNNHGLRVFAVTDTGLNIGTANPYHGTQIWKIDDGSGDDANAQLERNAFTYDKYDAESKAANHKGLNVGIAFNGAGVDEVRYDEHPLAAGTDYTVTDSGLTLSSDLLNGKKTGSTGTVTVVFSRGARARFTVTIKDGTPGASKPSQQQSKPAGSATAKKPAKKTGSTANTGAAVIGVVVAAAVALVAGGAALMLRKRA